MPGNTSRSFVVRVWVEPREVPDQRLEWRGMVQDVITGERKYFMKFDDLINFIVGHFSTDNAESKES